MDFTDRDSGHADVGYSDGIHLMQMARIIWAATSGTRSRLSQSLALLGTAVAIDPNFAMWLV